MLICDEATASLDNITANEIERTIMDMTDLTCIFLTHRYSCDILADCDGLLVMRDGQLHEEGTFTELYNQKGYFYSLLNVQF